MNESKAKVAVLVSGLWRNFEKMWPRNKEILNRLDIDYELFLCTWFQNPRLPTVITPENIGNRYFWWPKPRLYPPYDLERVDEKSIESFLKSKKFEISEFIEEELIGNLDLARGKNRQQQINSISMYLGIERVYLFFLKSGESLDYTHFLRLRTDFELQNPKIWNTVWGYDLFFVGPSLKFSNIQVSDQCFGGKMKIAESALCTSKTLVSLINSDAWQSNKEELVLGESFLAHHLSPFYGKLNIGHYKNLGRLTRPKTISSDYPYSLDFTVSVASHNLRYLKHKLKTIGFGIAQFLLGVTRKINGN